MTLLPPLHASWELSPPSSRVPLTLIGLVTAGISVILDQATKQLAATQLLPVGRRVELPGPLTLQLTFNDGGAFGYNAPWWFFLVITVVVTVVVVRNLPRAELTSQAVAYGLLLSGALGNALDRVFRVGDPGDPRFFHGHVVDFIASAKYPTFNVADISITAGFALLLLTLFLEERSARSARPDDVDHGAGPRLAAAPDA